MYFKQLDFLRFYAAFQVMILHMHFTGTDNFLFHLLWSVEGVYLFFIISGFLITGILMNTRDSRSGSAFEKFKVFYVRRMLRIFPIYYLVVFLLLILYKVYRPFFWVDFIYASNIYYGILGYFPDSPVPHFWSLAMEEQFYLVWPFLIYFLPVRKLWIFLLVVFVGFLLIHQYLMFTGFAFLSDRTFNCVTYLSGGALLSYVYKYKNQFFKWMPHFFLASSIVYVVAIGLKYYNQFSTPDSIQALISLVFSISLVGFFIKGSDNRFSRLLFENRYLVYLGKISYGLYVYHLLMIFPLTAIKKLLHVSDLGHNTEGVLKIAMTILIASLSWKFFESPINKLKEKFSYLN